MDALIRTRLKVLRELYGYSQERMAELLGFKDRQTVSDLELGERKITPSDLVQAAEAFNMDVEALLDPFRLVGEGQFCWRQKNSDTDELRDFEERAGQWIATYRHLSRLKGETVNSGLRRVDVTEKSSFEDAALEGEAIGQALKLGTVPAKTLGTTLEEQLDTLVLYVDAVPGVSGAACQLGQLNTILINRREVPARQCFDMAHELFHLLTWQQMPPKHIEDACDSTRNDKRIEQLAESFAAGLLMPSSTINELICAAPIPAEDEIIPWLTGLAEYLEVSTIALLWRLVNLGIVRQAVAKRIQDTKQLPKTTLNTSLMRPRLSKRFVGTLGWGIHTGHLSVRRAASAVGITVDDLSTLFEEHQLQPPFSL